MIKQNLGTILPQHCERDFAAKPGKVVDESVEWGDGIQIKDGMIIRPKHPPGDIVRIDFPKD